MGGIPQDSHQDQQRYHRGHPPHGSRQGGFPGGRKSLALSLVLLHLGNCVGMGVWRGRGVCMDKPPHGMAMVLHIPRRGRRVLQLVSIAATMIVIISLIIMAEKHFRVVLMSTMGMVALVVAVVVRLHPPPPPPLHHQHQQQHHHQARKRPIQKQLPPSRIHKTEPVRWSRMSPGIPLE